MNNQFSVLVKRYLVAAIIALFGLIMLGVGIRSNQSALFMFASVNLLIGGVLAVLFSAGTLKRTGVFVIGVVCIVVTVFLLVQTYVSIGKTIEHNEARTRSMELVRFNLTQVRDIQRAHRTSNGRYAADWEELSAFFNDGKITVIESEKSVPEINFTREIIQILYGDNRAMNRLLNEREAAILASMGNPTNIPELEGFRRDTVIKSFKEDFLNSIPRIKERQRLGLGGLKIDELRFIPMTDPKQEWSLETRTSVPYNQDTIPTIRVEGLEPIPMFENGSRQLIGFGNIKTNSDKASWE